MILDTRTLIVVLVGIGMLFGAAAFMTWRAHRHIAALAYWASAALLGVFGLAIVTLYGVLPMAVAVPVSNAGVMASYVLIWFGVRSFAGRTIPLRAGALIFAALTVGTNYHLFVVDDIVARILVNSAGIIGLSLLTAAELWRMEAARSPRKAKRMTALVFFGHALFVLVRGAMTPGAGPLDNLLSPNALQGIAFLEAILAVTAWSFGFLAMTSERLQADLDQLATVDPLTGTLNRRAFLMQAERELVRAARTGAPLVLLLLDIDRFKRINDSFGHLAGDALLRAFTETVTTRLRRTDLFGRYGGEEFCLLLPDTDRVGAASLAETLRLAFDQRVVELDGNCLSASVSIGMAESRGDMDLTTLLSNADAALYQAKRNGRNQVVLAPDAAD